MKISSPKDVLANDVTAGSLLMTSVQEAVSRRILGLPHEGIQSAKRKSDRKNLAVANGRRVLTY